MFPQEIIPKSLPLYSLYFIWLERRIKREQQFLLQERRLVSPLRFSLHQFFLFPREGLSLFSPWDQREWYVIFLSLNKLYSLPIIYFLFLYFHLVFLVVSTCASTLIPNTIYTLKELTLSLEGKTESEQEEKGKGTGDHGCFSFHKCKKKKRSTETTKTI